MAHYIGIDLGTTFSAVSHLDEMGRPSIMHFSNGSNTVRSTVTFMSDGSSVVGDPVGIDCTAERFKREMGTEWTFDGNGKSYNPTDLSTFVLKKIHDEVNTNLGQIAEAVVTIPANFANDAREATMNAAKAAGINVKFIINEPTAAALYFASQQTGSVGGIYAIYDLGGGTFDISIIKLAGEDVEVLATEGVHKLGGRDFDDKLTELVKKKYKEASGGDLESEDFTPEDAENMKRSLSQRDSVSKRIVRTNIEITRKEFEESISSLIAQTEMLCESVLDEANISLSEVQEVILVGGSTRMPVVSESVKRVFGKEAIKFGNPDEVVALGASLYAAFKSDRTHMNKLQKDAVEQIKVSDITSKAYGTSVLATNPATGQKEMVNSIVIPKGHKIPCSITQPNYTVADNQQVVNIDINESNAEERDLNFVTKVWEGQLNLPAGRPANQQIDVTFSYTVNQTVQAEFLDVASGNKEVVEIELAANTKPTVDMNKFTVE